MTSDTDGRLLVLDPTADVYGEAADPLAPRLTSLSGKRLGLLWNGKANGDIALRRTAELIVERVPDLDVRFYSGSLPCPPELLELAAAECDVVLACTAD